jgi:predicted small integral membrane protein
MFDLRLIRADALKLRRRRGMLALCVVLTLGIVAIVFAVTGVQHATNPSHYGPAGGLKNYQGAMFLLTMLMLVVGTIIGSTAGAQDLESGVFRDLAATGRSRLALFGARIPGAWTIVLPIAALASVAAAVGSFALAGPLAGPGTGAIVAGTIGVLAAGALSAAVAVGLAALTGSRASVITTMLAFVLAIAPLLSGLTFLGDARQVIPTNALARIGDARNQDLHMALITAIVVVLAWAGAAFAAGAWRTRTREI